MKNDMRYSSVAEELQAERTVTYFTVGGSMRPLLKERCTHVKIQPLTQASNGDILLYVRPDGKQVLHRLISQDAEHFYLRGDNTYELEKLPRANAIGVVTHVFRNGRVIDVKNDAAYRRYVAFWNAIYPVRLLWRLLKLGLRRVIK